MKRSICRHLSTIELGSSLKTCSNLRLIEQVISEAQEATIGRFLSSILSRKRYEGNHWDDVIQQYKEIELSNYKVPTEVDDIVKQIEEKIVDIIGKPVTFLSPHAIELAENGFIGPHVDSIKFSGGFIAGLSLQSPRILALSYHAEGVTLEEQSAQLEALALRNKCGTMCGSNLYVGSHGLSFETSGCDVYQSNVVAGKFNNRLLKQPTLNSSSMSNDFEVLPELVEVALPPRSLYLLSGLWRYNYDHAILGREQQPRLIAPLLSATACRSSLIFRDVKG